MNPLGELLRHRREELRSRGISVVQIATRAGLPESTVYEYLKRRQPSEQMPRRATLEKLADGFQLRVDEVVEAAKDSMARVTTDPLTLLVKTGMIESGRSARQAVIAAKKRKHQISEGTISTILADKHGEITPRVLDALAVGFDLDRSAVQTAYEQSARRRRYRLPAHIEEQLTPERWATILKIIENALTLE